MSRARRRRGTARRPDAGAAQLVQHIVGGWRCQALHAAVQLGLPDALATGPRSAPLLAQELGCHADALERLLRALCTLQVCRERADGGFALTGAGQRLCRTPPTGRPSLRDLVRWWGGPLWPMWGELTYSVRTGASARQKLSGDAAYAHLDRSAEVAAIFHGAQQAMTALVVDDLAGWPGWRGARRLVDVGGGHGQVALALMRAHAQLQATVFDLEHAAAGAQAQLQQAGLVGRGRFEAGSFFERVPAGADVYLLKSILHNWDDTRAAAIVAACAQAAPPGATLLLVERVRPERLRPGVHDEAVARTDLNMLAGLGGRERTLAQYAALLRAHALHVVDLRPLSFEFTLVAARRAVRGRAA